VVAGAFNDTKRPPFTTADIRFTTRRAVRQGQERETLYAVALAVPEAGATLAIRALGTGTGRYGAIATVELLGSDAALVWRRDDNALMITLPADYRGEHAVAFRITPAA